MFSLDGSMAAAIRISTRSLMFGRKRDGPAVTLVYSPGDTGHVMPMFVTPWVSANTPLKFKLTVSDPCGGTSSAYVTVTVINWHTPPDASHATRQCEGALAARSQDGSGEDPWRG